MNSIAIHLENVSFSFLKSGTPNSSIREWIQRGGKGSLEKKKVLENINLNIEKGSCFGILGRNGSGKSTLLRVISGIIHPDQGKVIINGKIAPILSLGAGLEPELTGYDNIKLVCILMGISTSQINSSIDKIAAFSELSKDELSMQVKRYSTGMTARLSFSIAIAADPDILIIDEVLAVGDVGFQEKCYRRINDIKKNGATIVFVSHSMGDVMQICDHACVLNNGEIIFNGLVNEACEKYQQQFHS